MFVFVSPNTLVCNDWTELSCTGDAAPEDLEEHSMVAHEVKKTIYYLMFACFSANVTILSVSRTSSRGLIFSGLLVRVWWHTGFGIHHVDVSPVGV